ncbi:Glycosyl transferase family 2 [Candidatus Hepatincola sp. Pdp]
MAKVTICIPVYNTHKYLKQCLDSVIQQTFTDIEIIIVNDASSSNLEENIILDYQQKDNRIKYIKHETNLGIYHARETAVFVATSPYIFFLDSDDYLVNNAIELLFNKIHNSNLDFVYGSIIKFEPNKYIETKFILSQTLADSLLKKIPCVWNMFPRLFKISVVKQVYQKLAPYTKNIYINLSEDFLFTSILAINNNVKYDSIHNFVYFYRKNTQSLTATKNTKDIKHNEKICNQQLLILNIILNYLQDQNLIKKHYKFYSQLIYNFFIRNYKDIFKYYYHYILIHNLPDNISKNFNKYLLYEIFSHISLSQTAHSISVRNSNKNIFYKLFKKFEHSIKRKIIRYKNHKYLNKCYRHNLTMDISPWQEISKYPKIALSVFGEDLEDSHQHFLQYCLPKQTLFLPHTNKEIKVANQFILLSYFKLKITDKIINIASDKKISPYFLEDGFLRSIANIYNEEANPTYQKTLSFTLDDLSMHYDANKVSRLEQKLNSTEKLTKTNLVRAQQNITTIVTNNLSKYNDHLELDLPKGINLGFKNKKILVIDQAMKDNAVLYGKINKKHFNDMVKCAIAENPDADIIIKTHPDMIFNQSRIQYKSKNPKSGYISHLSESDGIISIKNNNVNPIALLKKVDKVYVCSSLMGMEALMCGKEVITFGAPFYAGWGLTDDRHSFFHTKEGKKRRNKKRSLEEIFYYSYIWYTRYVNYEQKRECSLEEHISNLIRLRKTFISLKG